MADAGVDGLRLREQWQFRVAAAGVGAFKLLNRPVVDIATDGGRSHDLRSDIGVAGDLLVLGYFKYAGFLAANLKLRSSRPGFHRQRTASVENLGSTPSPRSRFMVRRLPGACRALPAALMRCQILPASDSRAYLHHRDMTPQSSKRAAAKRRIRKFDPVWPDYIRHRVVQEDLSRRGIQPW